MMEQQKKQQETIAEQLQEQLRMCHSENSSTWERVEGQQQATEEKVEGLQEELQTLKSLLHGKFADTEARLKLVRERNAEEIQEAQEELKHHHHKQIEELHGELLKLTVSKETKRTPPLCPTAKVFVPCSATSGAEEEEEEAGTSGRVHWPPTFDGKVPWDAYRTQFEMLAAVNRWTVAQKATHLAVNLRGSALVILTNLSEASRRDYATLTAALENRFGTAHQTELNRTKFRGRVRHREESLHELAEDIERLARLAYPDTGEDMINILAKDQFIDALSDEELRLKIRQNRPNSIREALTTALELESYYLAGKQRSKMVRGAQIERPSGNRYQRTPRRGGYKGRATRNNNDGMVHQLQQCLEKFQQCLQEHDGSEKDSSAKAERRARATCWNCKEQGHY